MVLRDLFPESTADKLHRSTNAKSRRTDFQSMQRLLRDLLSSTELTLNFVMLRSHDTPQFRGLVLNEWCER